MNPAIVNAAGRHGISFVGGMLGILAVLGMLEPDQVKDIMAALQQTMDGLSQATAGLSKILWIVGPMLGVTGAAYAAKSATFLNQLKSVLDTASKNTSQGTEATKVLIDAAAKLPEVEKVIVAPTIAAAVPNEKVVAQ